jgi:hypothetical protein
MIANASISPAAGHSVIQILADYKRLSAVQAAGRLGRERAPWAATSG